MAKWNKLPQETVQVIIHHWTDLNTSMNDIIDKYGISWNLLMKILKENGIDTRNRNPPKTFTSEIIEEITLRYQNGEGYAKIAGDLHYDSLRVKALIVGLGIKRGKGPSKAELLPQEKINSIIFGYTQLNLSLTKLSEEYHFDRRTIKKVLKNNGIAIITHRVNRSGKITAPLAQPQEFVSDQFKIYGCELLTVYENAHQEIKFRCPCGNISATTWARFSQSGHSHQCKKCSRLKSVQDRRFKYFTNIVKPAFEIQKFKILTPSDEYVQITQKLNVECWRGHLCDISYGGLVNNAQECPICKKQNYIESCGFDFENPPKDVKLKISWKDALLFNKSPTYTQNIPAECYICEKIHLVNKHRLYYIVKGITSCLVCSQECKCELAKRTLRRRGTRSQLEMWTQEQLDTNFPYLQINYCNRSTLNGLELDILIPSINIAFELNGPLHYKPIYGEEKLYQIQERDIDKGKMCKTLGIDLYTINLSSHSFDNKKENHKHIDYIISVIKNYLEYSKPIA